MKPKRFIIWGINYSPELTGIAPYNAALCEHFRSQSHQVRMVTSFCYYPEWRKFPQDKGVLFRSDLVRGVDVHRCWHYVPKKPSALKRIFHELSFVASSWLRVMTLPRPDAYVVVSPPLLLGFAAWLAGWLKRSPFVFHVQDLQPDAAVSLGMMKGGLRLRLLYALESLAYRKAALVSGIIPGMTRAFARKGVPASRILLFPNGIELPPAGSLPYPGRFRRRFGISNDEFLGIYSGNLGVKHGVEILLEAARLSQGKPIRTVICGDGARRELLERRARDMGLANVLILPLQAEVEYHEMMVDADIYFVTQQAGSGALFFPSKLLKGLALAKAIIIVADEQSELTLAATEGRFALVVKPGHPEELAAAQERLAANKEERLALGRAGRKYVEQYELKGLLRAFESSLCGLLDRSCLPDPELAHSMNLPSPGLRPASPRIAGSGQGGNSPPLGRTLRPRTSEALVPPSPPREERAEERRPASRAGCCEDQGQGRVLGGSWPVGTVSAPRELPLVPERTKSESAQ